MNKYWIILTGCDDSTEIPIESLTENDVCLLEKIAKLSEEISSYGCMPTLQFMSEEEYQKNYT